MTVCWSVDFNCLASCVPAAVATHVVGSLGCATPVAGATRCGAEGPGGRLATAALGLRGLLLGNGHRRFLGGDRWSELGIRMSRVLS